MGLEKDIILDSGAFDTAAADMKELKTRAENLKKNLQFMYRELTTALDTPAGRKVEMTAEKVLIKPIDDLVLVIEHVSSTLTEIIGTGHYKDVFIKFEELNSSLQFNYINGI